MTSPGSFVHGSPEGEQDIEEFLSQIEDMTSAVADGSGEVNLHGGSTADAMDLFLGSPSPPIPQLSSDGRAGEVVLESDEGRAIADAFPADWLSNLEQFRIDKSSPSAQPAEQRTRAPVDAEGEHQHHLQEGQQKVENQQHQSEEQESQEQHRVVEDQGNENEEILGREPEILDMETAYHSGAAAAGMLMSAGGRMASWATGTPGSLVGAAAAALRGEIRQAEGRSPVDGRDETGSAESPSGTAAAAAEPPLDWPVTLDMLGVPDEETQPKLTAPVSELPNTPVPTESKGAFPDFVEIRNSLKVSQFPKPGNLVEGGSNRGADGQSEDGDGDGGSDRAPAVGRGQGQEQRQVHRLPLRTVEVYLRPDVTWESVSDTYMAVMLSRGLVVRQQTERMVIAEKSADSPGDWATVKLTVGVTRDKLRTLVIQFYADSRAPMLKFAGTLARFSGRAGDELYSAIRDALVERRIPLSFLATDAQDVSLDPHYVRDLVAMYAHENVVNLTRYALPLEEFVRKEEERSARLEATLLPQYTANGLEPPRPTRSKPLSAYPLTTRRPPVASCGVEEALEVMYRARERTHNPTIPTSSLLAQQEHGGDEKDESRGVDGNDNAIGEREEGGVDKRRREGRNRGSMGAGRRSDVVAEEIRSLIRATWEDVKNWCDEEAEARVRRKDAQVRDRLLAVERHREALISALRDGAGGSSASRTPVGREFAARFRPMAEEAILCHCKAVHAKRVGQLYLTYNHLCFHSSVLGFTSQRVLPLMTVASVSHASSLLAMDLVTLVDCGGEEHSFGITAVEASFPQRFHDLLKQCLVLCKADASRRAAEREGAAARDEEPDEEQILARVQRVAKAKQLREAREAAASVTSTTTTPITTGDAVVVLPAPGREARKEPDEAGQLEKSVIAGNIGGVVEGGAGGAIGMGAGESTGTGNDGTRGGQAAGGGAVRGGGGRPGSMMAMGIQAFLEESQKRS